MSESDDAAASAAPTDEAWEDDIIRALRSLVGDDVPSLEIVTIDAVAEWVFSPANPGEGYGQEHAGHLISTLFTALDTARGFQPRQEPERTEEITAARARVVDGAHELASAGREGVSTIISRLMPAIIGQLQDNAGDAGKQAYWCYVYLLYVLGVGTRTEQDQTIMNGVMASFTGWDALMREGFVVPWRRQLPPEPKA